MHPCPGNWVANGRAVIFFAWCAQTFSAGIKCWYCTIPCDGVIGVHLWLINFFLTIFDVNVFVFFKTLILRVSSLWESKPCGVWILTSSDNFEHDSSK